MKEIYERRSIRDFLSKDFPADILRKIIEAALKAPSAKNRQPWSFAVLTWGAKDKLVDLMRQGIEKEYNTMKLLPNSTKYIMSAQHTADIMEQAPIVIVVFNPKGKSLYDNLTPEEKIYERADIQSIGAAIQNMLLEATSLGIGTLWICDTYFAYDDLREHFKDKGEIIAAVALGYPAETPSERPRKAFDEAVDFL